MKWRENSHKFVSYPVIAFLVSAGFIAMMFSVLPYVNMLGAQAFLKGNAGDYIYFALPYGALDVLLLYGYFRLAGRFAPRFDAWMAGIFEKKKETKFPDLGKIGGSKA